MHILFNNAAHWVTVEAVTGSMVKVYDSTNCKPNLSIQVQASSILRTTGKQDHILFQLERMQLQKGGVDCGLFAIAYVTDLCNGNNPANYRQVVFSCLTVAKSV